MGWLEKLFDPQVWKAVLVHYRDEPALFIPLILAVLIGLWLRGQFSKSHVEALKTRNEDLESRLRDAREDLHKAEAKQEGLTTQIEKLTAVATEISTVANQLKEIHASQPKPEPPMKWIDPHEAMRVLAQEKYINTLIRGSSGLAIDARSLSQVNTELRETLSTISGKLEGTSTMRAEATVFSPAKAILGIDEQGMGPKPSHRTILDEIAKPSKPRDG